MKVDFYRVRRSQPGEFFAEIYSLFQRDIVTRRQTIHSGHIKNSGRVSQANFQNISDID